MAVLLDLLFEMSSIELLKHIVQRIVKSPQGYQLAKPVCYSYVVTHASISVYYPLSMRDLPKGKKGA